MDWLWMSLYRGLAMFWNLLWALVLGFAFSGMLQAFVSREAISRALGRSGFREVLLATGIGAASSSCSYAAAATGRSAFQKGAAFVPVLAFMFASTNLVIELGAVLWLLMGWRFVLAEIVGAFLLIGLIWIFARAFFPRDLEQKAREQVQRAGDSGHHHHGGGDDGKSTLGQRFVRRKNWAAAASAFFMDWGMLWKEMLIGFLLGGFLSVAIPAQWWETLFVTGGSPAWQLIENALIGPLIAAASFVCSIGNVPLANLLWSHGISFGGVIAFIYGDLIVIPLVLVYAKYYGRRTAVYMTAALYVSMVIAGVLVDVIFNALGLIPGGTRPGAALSHASFSWNYTTWLDIAALALCVVFLWLKVSGKKAQNSPSEHHDHTMHEGHHSHGHEGHAGH